MGKNKIISLIVLTVIGLAIGGVVCNKAVYTLEDETVKKTETTLSDLSVETIETRIEFLTDQIRLFNKQLETEDLDSEERFEIGEAITFTRSEIHKFQQELKRRQELKQRRNTKRWFFFDALHNNK